MNAITRLLVIQHASVTLVQLSVLGFRLLQDGDVRVGVLPEGEEIVVSRLRAGPRGSGIGSLRGCRLQRVCPSHAQVSQGTGPAIPDYAAVIDNFLEFGGGLLAPPGGEISITADIGGIERSRINSKQETPIFDRRDALGVIQDVRWVSSIDRQLFSNSGQPKRLHLGIQGEPLVQVLRQGLSP